MGLMLPDYFCIDMIQQDTAVNYTFSLFIYYTISKMAHYCTSSFGLTNSSLSLSNVNFEILRISKVFCFLTKNVKLLFSCNLLI